MPMVIKTLSSLARVRITLGYAMALVTVATALVILGPQAQDRAVRSASTNLHNLADGRLVTLLDSAFVADAGPIYLWLPGLICLLALAELVWRRGRLLMAFVVGHVGATLLVAVGLAVAIEAGWLPLAISRATDVGMSYGAMAVFGALSAAIPGRWRPVWVGWWLPLALATAVVGGHFTDVGHAIALTLGMLMATRFGGPARWTPVRYALLTVAGLFGFLVLAHTGWAVLAGLGLGTAGALTAEFVTRRRMVRPRLAAAKPVTRQLALQA